MQKIQPNPFTIIRGGLHPDEKPAKPAKKEKYTAFQLQLIAQAERRVIAQMKRHAERYWAAKAAKNK
jgi:hypothetical protein